MKGTAREARQTVTRDEAATGSAGVEAERKKPFEQQATENLPVVGDWLAGKLFGSREERRARTATPGGKRRRPAAVPDETGWGDSSP